MNDSTFKQKFTPTTDKPFPQLTTASSTKSFYATKIIDGEKFWAKIDGKYISAYDFISHPWEEYEEINVSLSFTSCKF